MPDGLHISFAQPADALSPYVERFWVLHNTSGSDRELVIIPDGRIDLTLSRSASEPFHIIRSGLETHAERVFLPVGTLIFAISFKLPATEYIFGNPVASFLNSAEVLPNDFWEFSVADLADFNLFCKNASRKITSLLPKEPDERKLKLFSLLYASGGALTVKELSHSVYWSSRQIGRYFHQQFGLSLKAYCNILRFWASLEGLAQGRFFPDLSFADQSHFIREVKKFTGVSPKELKRNTNDRFIQFSAGAAK